MAFDRLIEWAGPERRKRPRTNDSVELARAWRALNREREAMADTVLYCVGLVGVAVVVIVLMLLYLWVRG